MLARLFAFAIWALVAATAVFWGLRLLVRSPAAPTYAVAVGDAAAVHGDLARLLGSAPVNALAAQAAPEASSRFRLLGIVAPKYPGSAAPATHSVALIAVDGKMPKAYEVGAHVDGDLVLQSVSLRTVSIAPAKGAPTITLELPLPAAAATGTLPGPSPVGGYVAPTAVPAPQYVPQPMAPQDGPRPTPVPPMSPQPPGTMVPRSELSAPTL